MRAAVVLALALAACSAGAEKAARADIAACSDTVTMACVSAANGLRVHVKSEAAAQAGTDGTLVLDVLSADGAVLTTLREDNVAAPQPPELTDIDGDGDADILVTRMTGNVNAEWGVWRNESTPERAAFVRLGEIAGVQRARTEDGYLAVPARSGAADWSVSFYRFDPAALTLLASVAVHFSGEDGRATCSLEEAPGAASLGLSNADAERKFCAEPAAQVFE